ncbi:WD40-repeat-containing domain protein [Xylariomycetidae sp. FL2044]|nr:WD40-repeat-containing domain protein [Xylariomycetidae sp. FL2044]
MEAEGRNIESLRSLNLHLPPSCIEFCPFHPEYLVVGTYNLQRDEAAEAEQPISRPAGGGGEEEQEEDQEDQEDQEQQPVEGRHQSRNGSLVVFQLPTEGLELRHIQTIPYPSAILDLHFHPSQSDVMVIVSSTGSLSFFRMRPSPDESLEKTLQEISTHRPLGDDESVLILSCAWHPTIRDLLAITTSDHQVHILHVNDSWDVYATSSRPILTHSLEAWTVAFSPISTAAPSEYGNESSDQLLLTIFSGGDDSKLLSTSCLYSAFGEDKDEEMIDAVSYPTVAIRGHNAGVTAILPLSTIKLNDGSLLLLTGSYDDHIRIYTVHSSPEQMMVKRPRMMAETNLGGGVWRLKVVEVKEVQEGGTRIGWSVLVLASCMHAGARVLLVSGDYDGICQVQVVGRFEEHESMNYGSDFQPGSEQKSGRTLRCVSTSFYDRLLCVWELSL